MRGNETQILCELFNDNDGFTLISHISPDGDTLGSSLALMHVLKKMGKTVELVCDDNMPRVYGFLPGIALFVQPEQAKGYECAVAVDCADAERMGRSASLFKSARHTVNIDHHGTNTGFGSVNFVVPAAATGELIFEIAHSIMETLDNEIAMCLYTALMTDTGNFAYSNTTSNTHITAAELLKYDIDPANLNRMVYRSVPVRKVKLLGIVLNKMRILADGKIGISMITGDDLLKSGAMEEDTEGIIDHIRDIDTVEIAILARVCTDGSCKVSLRSKEYADVSKIASCFGGGGHKRAAGYTVAMDISEACARAEAAALNTLGL